MIIVRQLLDDKDSELLMLPNMNKVYMKSHDGEALVTVDLTLGNASVDNHRFGYDIPISRRVVEYVQRNFISEVEKRRKVMEDEYRRNRNNSLSNVIKNLKK